AFDLPSTSSNESHFGHLKWQSGSDIAPHPSPTSATMMSSSWFAPSATLPTASWHGWRAGSRPPGSARSIAGSGRRRGMAGDHSGPTRNTTDGPPHPKAYRPGGEAGDQPGRFQQAALASFPV